MRVAPDFLAPLLEGFRDPEVSSPSPARSSFSDPAKVREETGLTQGWWQDGGLRVRHRIDPAVDDLFPCFYGGGGSCAFDRAQVSRAGRLRPAAGALLPGRHRPRLHGLEARLEGAVPAAQRGVSRAPRHHRQALHAKTRSRPCSRRTTCCSAGRTSTSGGAWRRTSSSRWAGALLSVMFGDVPGCGRTSRRSGAPSGSCRRPCARAGARAAWRVVERHGSVPAPAGRLFPRPLRAHGAARPSGCACCSFRPIRSARRCTAAASSCTRRCGELAQAGGSPRGGAAGLAVAGAGQPGAARLLRLGRMAGAARRAVRKAWARCCRTPCANSPTTIWTG